MIINPEIVAITPNMSGMQPMIVPIPAPLVEITIAYRVFMSVTASDTIPESVNFCFSPVF